ncbi:long-chain fatty acid transporter fat1 [Diatrype stigma]|uniref:Long-chain fatty acid transporter fat1 n=1 Tax=Diatrype stigma TaxID=117547 RepID=A0AAN9YNW3_9PEZI
MALGAAAGTIALGAYLDARFHIRHDLRNGNNRSRAAAGMNFVAERAKVGKLFLYNELEDAVGTPKGDYLFLIFEDRQWTFAEFFHALQPVGNWLMKDLGVQKGDMVALYGGNSPEYLMLLFALEAIGAKAALVNCNLTAQPLVHCIRLSGARLVLADAGSRSLISPVEGELEGLDAKAKVTYYDTTSIAALTDREPLPPSRRQGASPMDVSSLLYTSGTTGMPKATVMTRARLLAFLRMSHSHFLQPGDRLYTCLPLYHATALILGVYFCLGAGAVVVLSSKFSHARFWPEVHSSQATHIQYIGELARYLLNAPPSPLDRGHKVRLAWGNGMRPDVWERFRERFGIECIYELYGASDGMFQSTNPNRGPFTRNAVGVQGLLWHWWNGRDQKRVRIDPDTQEILRGGSGFAIECKPNEAGEAIVRMNPSAPDQGTPTYYKNHEAAVKRRIADVFEKGDLWFRSGDLMRLDADGRLYFVDRLGDTFRWHSENVSTNEVADIVGGFPQVVEVNVYGVAVPHADGRAGCAAIVPNTKEIDWKGLAEHCLAQLPRYAVPIFIRVVDALEHTSTMKLQKGTLRNEGIDLDRMEQALQDRDGRLDPIYWLPPGSNIYVPFTKKELGELRQGQHKL